MIRETPVIQRNEYCRLCSSSSLELVIALEPTPLANSLVTAEQLDVAEDRYPLDVFICRNCSHIQLLDVVDPEILFRDYAYVSGTSQLYVDYLKQYANDVIEVYGLKEGDLVVEIGSNDGTLLRHFVNRGLRVLGVDPARNLAEMAEQSGIPTIAKFFTPDLAKELKETHGSAKLLIANHVFAHADNLKSVVDGVRELLTSDGIFAFEVSYWLDVYKKALFDTIYHEHLSYHTVGPLTGFFARNGMELIDTQRVNHQGGSLRCMVQLEGGPWPQNLSVQRLIREEDEHLSPGVNTRFKDLSELIELGRRQLTELLASIQAEGGRVAGYGAPAKTTTLMYQFGLDAGQLEFIADDSPLKQGLFTPGLHIPIVSPEEIYNRRPDYLLVLAWNFADSIMDRHRAFAEAGGKFIVPLPTLRIC